MTQDRKPPESFGPVSAGMAREGKWSDLARRVVSASILIGIGVVLAFATGLWLRLGIAVIIGITFWELARLTGWRHPEMHHTPFGKNRPVILGALAGVSLFAALIWDGGLPVLFLLVPIFAGLPGAMARDRVPFVLFGMAILFVGYGLIGLREAYGLDFILWLIGVVVISDILGYFAGRMIGGPKFWPALSPKKTWSGTVAGWIGTALFGMILAILGIGNWELVVISPLVALAGQLGDIAESWLKRRAGVKDSSDLIPGHGGLMDRFDAITGATLAVLLVGLIINLPAIGG